VKGKTITQKCIMTNSKDIDILHRVEKLAHHLPGSNILLTKALYDSLRSPPEKLVELGLFYVDGQVDPVHVFGLLSDKVKTRDVTAIRAKKKS
jgi:class 3 adenylate cyclase